MSRGHPLSQRNFISNFENVGYEEHFTITLIFEEDEFLTIHEFAFAQNLSIKDFIINTVLKRINENEKM